MLKTVRHTIFVAHLEQVTPTWAILVRSAFIFTLRQHHRVQGVAEIFATFAACLLNVSLGKKRVALGEIIFRQEHSCILPPSR